MTFRKYTSIDNFKNYYKDRLDSIQYHEKLIDEAVFLYKWKLHGTNGCIYIDSEGNFHGQKRTSFVTEHDNNSGFYQFVKEVERYCSPIHNYLKNTYIYGEFCGKGIQSGVAACQTDFKYFAVFEAFKDDKWIDVSKVEKYLKHDKIKFIHFEPEMIKVNFADIESVREFHKKCIDIVKVMETLDPWVEKTFGIKGPGEGAIFTDLITKSKFKEKIEKFTEVKTISRKEKIDLGPVKSFVHSVLTEHRLEKAYDVFSERKTIRELGLFLKYIGQDIQNECRAELSESGLDWKPVSTEISNQAKSFYFKKINLI